MFQWKPRSIVLLTSLALIAAALGFGSGGFGGTGWHWG
jgi:uncharacterized membrane protein YtjA (UPF0391 family)